MGVHMLTGGGAICLCHCGGTVCNWGFGVGGARRYSSCGYPCIVHIYFLAFG